FLVPPLCRTDDPGPSTPLRIPEALSIGSPPENELLARLPRTSEQVPLLHLVRMRSIPQTAERSSSPEFAPNGQISVCYRFGDLGCRLHSYCSLLHSAHSKMSHQERGLLRSHYVEIVQ